MRTNLLILPGISSFIVALGTFFHKKGLQEAGLKIIELFKQNISAEAEN